MQRSRPVRRATAPASPSRKKSMAGCCGMTENSCIQSAGTFQLCSSTKRYQFRVEFMKILIIVTFLVAPLIGCSADSQPPAGFTALFNGKDLSNWKVPLGDNGHWKVLDGVIDYDAQSEAMGEKSLWTQKEYTDFVLQVDWRFKETPYTNPNVYYILPDGSHGRDVHGKELRL